MSIADLPRDCKARAEKEGNVKNNNTSPVNFYVYRGKCLENAERGWNGTIFVRARKWWGGCSTTDKNEKIYDVALGYKRVGTDVGSIVGTRYVFWCF